ncbi:MAG: hypothetical protein JSR60_19340 [Proteobacteria bacterium]|nr:hypothetical protein [Pseudomonadota bacterium]
MKWRAAFGAAALVLLPEAAQAHLVITGMGPVYDGMLHFGLSPEDYLPIVVLAFFSGLRGSSAARMALGGLVVGWLAGGLVAMYVTSVSPELTSVATAMLFLVLGGLLASNFAVSARAVGVAGALLGLVRGLADLAGTAFSVPHTLTLIGMTASGFVVFSLAASLTLPLKRAWLIVAARVSGSWLAALGLLLLGWIVRYGPIVG